MAMWQTNGESLENKSSNLFALGYMYVAIDTIFFLVDADLCLKSREVEKVS